MENLKIQKVLSTQKWERQTQEEALTEKTPQPRLSIKRETHILGPSHLNPRSGETNYKSDNP